MSKIVVCRQKNVKLDYGHSAVLVYRYCCRSCLRNLKKKGEEREKSEAVCMTTICDSLVASVDVGRGARNLRCREGVRRP